MSSKSLICIVAGIVMFVVSSVFLPGKVFADNFATGEKFNPGSEDVVVENVSVSTGINSSARMSQRKAVVEATMAKMKMMYNQKVQVPGYEVSASGCGYHLCPSAQEDWCGYYSSIISFQRACGCVDCDFRIVIDPLHPGQRDFSNEPILVYVSSDGEMFSPSIYYHSSGYGRRASWKEYEGDVSRVYTRVEEAMQSFLLAKPIGN